MIYLDNAATSWPKPEEVYLAVDGSLRKGGNPGRSGHKSSVAAGRSVEEVRLLLARLFHVSKPENIIFTLNATQALNLAIKGILRNGDHVITSSMEHNSVARPLEAMKACGIKVTKIFTDPLSGVDIGKIKDAIQANTRLMVFSHISNVTGTVNPIAKIGELCRERGIIFLVDASQSAGAFPIDVEKMQIDLLAFPGHKSLLGPQGTGGLYIREGIRLKPLLEGGTGSYSQSLLQPPNMPDRYESGTLNVCGIAGLAAGVRFLLEKGVETIQERETALANRFIEGIEQIPGVTLYGPPAGKLRPGVVSIVMDGIEPAQTAMILDNVFDIAVRAGLQCAPDAHQTIGTLATGGTVRFSMGAFTTKEEIDLSLNALLSIAKETGCKGIKV